MAHYDLMKIYEVLDHTADIRIRIKAKDLKGLFENSALAMFDIMGQIAPIPYGPAAIEIKKFRFAVTQKAEDLEELFINWLNELLSLSAAKELMFTDFIINRLDKTNIEAEVYGEDIKNYKINTEIKAATYHELKLAEINSGWQAEVIFDV
jgi:SHS2 domain-containing protein